MLVYKTDLILITWISVIFILNSLKPWIDYLLPIHYQAITVFQFIPLLILITHFNKDFYKKIDLPSAFLIIYIVVILFQQALIHIFEKNVFAVISSLYVFVRTLFIVYLLQVLLSPKRRETFFEAIKLILMIYFLVTFLYSIMQHPQVFDNEVIKEFGGNSTSGNGLGFFRTNGGIGGTVVDYANFLLAVFWVLLFRPFNNKKTQILMLLIFVISAILCFSRSLFLSIMFILIVQLINVNNTKKIILLVCLSTVVLLLLSSSLEFLVLNYALIAGDSDNYRVEQWRDLFQNFSFAEYLMGRNLGGNTGLFYGPEHKISGDGFIMGFTYDAGIIGIVSLILVIFSRIFSCNCNLQIKISMIGSLLVMLAVNSGFEKLNIVLVYMLSIAIVSDAHRYRKPIVV